MVKRLLDLVFASIGLVILAPLMIPALVVNADSAGIGSTAAVDPRITPIVP